ncbi:MAG: HAMP domain-containing protein, partial [Chloroflexi bacterium]|nr:HAMP domain-containing protein [Chloroflexota bacterium]
MGSRGPLSARVGASPAAESDRATRPVPTATTPHDIQSDQTDRKQDSNIFSFRLTPVIFLVNRIGLQKRISVLVALALVIMFAFFTLMGLDAVRQSTQQTMQERLIMTSMATERTDQILRRGLEELEKRANPELLDLRDGNLEPKKTLLRSLYPDPGIFTYAVFLLDARGRIIWVEPEDPELIGYDLSVVSDVRNTLETGRSGVSIMVMAPITYRPVVLLSVPVRDKDHQIVGLIGGAVDLTNPRIGEFIQPIQLPGQTTHTELIDANGMVLASSNPAHALRPWHHGHSFARLIKGRKPTVATYPVEGETGEQRQDVVAFATLSTASWGVGVEQDEGEAFAPTRALQMRTFILGVLSFFFGIGLAWLTTRSVVAPIKVLTDSVQRIAGGDLATAVPSMGTDEIGRLAQTFDEMRERLRSSREEIEQWNEELEARVQRRTRELSTLFEVSKILTSTFDLDNLLKAIVAKTMDVFEAADAGALLLYDRRSDRLIARSAAGLDLNLLAQVAIRPGEATFGRVFTARRAALYGSAAEIVDATSDLSWENRRYFEEALGKNVTLQSLICVPLVSRHVPIGSLFLASFQKDKPFSRSDVHLLQAMADQIAIALEEARLRQEAGQARALKEADRLKSEFISTVSHELRTPLASIKGYTTTLLRSDKNAIWDEGTKREFLEIVDEESDKLRELIDNLLEMSKMEAGGLQIEKQPVLVQRIAKEAVEKSRLRA